jgi:glycosyltransferase involved in cell wall biosynthesis
MVTQPARLALAMQAIADFGGQTHRERELVIVHDGDAAFHENLASMAASVTEAMVNVLRPAPGSTLGALRNLAVKRAAGDFVCQWDDDDRYHPQRLALQMQALRDERKDFCFLVDQLHWIRERGEMFWDDWNAEAYPMNLVQGTLLGRRELMPAYPDLARGEDTGLVLGILQRGYGIARLRGAGWCYVYVCHGSNAWDVQHHVAISRAKAYRHAQLLQREGLLRRRLSEYANGFGIVHMPHESGILAIANDGAAR